MALGGGAEQAVKPEVRPEDLEPRDELERAGRDDADLRQQAGLLRPGRVSGAYEGDSGAAALDLGLSQVRAGNSSRPEACLREFEILLRLGELAFRDDAGLLRPECREIPHCDP